MKPKLNFLDYMQKSTFRKTNTAGNPERTIPTEKPMRMFFFTPIQDGWSWMFDDAHEPRAAKEKVWVKPCLCVRRA